MLAEFAYNNIKYSIIGISPFYTCYRFYLYLKYKIEVDNNSFILAAFKRIKRIFSKYKTLVKYWEHAAETQVKYYDYYY